jgi:hypothetical protein
MAGTAEQDRYVALPVGQRDRAQHDVRFDHFSSFLALLLDMWAKKVP